MTSYWVHGSTVIDPHEKGWHFSRRATGVIIAPPSGTSNQTATFFFPIQTVLGLTPVNVWVDLYPGNKGKVMKVQCYTGASENGAAWTFSPPLGVGNDGIQGPYAIANASLRAGVLQVGVTVNMDSGGDNLRIQGVAVTFK
jgi:hypothetical protein